MLKYIFIVFEIERSEKETYSLFLNFSPNQNVFFFSQDSYTDSPQRDIKGGWGGVGVNK